MITPEQEAKLPRYARDELAYLRAKLDRANSALDAVNNERPAPVAVVNAYGNSFHGIRPRGVAWDLETVTFMMGPDATFDLDRDTGPSHNHIDVRRSDDGLSLKITTGGGSLIIEPHVSNSVAVSIRDRW